MFHYNCFDTETSGLDEKIHELLTGYFAIFDLDFNFLEDIEFWTGPSHDLKDFNVTAKAMEINGINLEEHIKHPNYMTYEECGKWLRKEFERLKAKYRPGRGAPFIALGQNIPFDIKFVMVKFGFTEDEWQRYFNRRVRDTSTNATFLKDAGIIPEHVNGLGGLCKHFGLKMGEAHVAKDDVHMTARLYQKQIQLIRGRKNAMSGIPTEVLRIIEG